MAKKELTIKQEYNKCKVIQHMMNAGEYVATLLPYGIMAIVNQEEWFVLNPEPWKIGLGGSIGIVLMTLAIFLITKRKENEKLTDGMVALIICWYAVAFIFFLLAEINMEIYKIMAYGGLGLIGALGLDVGSKNFKKKANAKKLALEKATTSLDTEKAIREINLEKEKKTKQKVEW